MNPNIVENNIQIGVYGIAPTIIDLHIPNDVLNSDNIRIIRPGLGLPPKYFQQVIGKVVKVDTKCGTPLSWKIID